MNALDELLSRWEECEERGEPVTPEELCRDCPEMLEEVRWHVHALREVESNFGVAPLGFEKDTRESGRKSRDRVGGRLQITNEYTVECHHASGGLGDVFVARELAFDRRVAIKFPRSGHLTHANRIRFEREARVTGRLDHPGIVAVHALAPSDEPHELCYVMRFVDGPTLHQKTVELHQSGSPRGDFFSSMEFRHLLQNFVALCNIAAYAHDKGVIHRDIKPGNVILGPFGETLLLDWGLARFTDEVEPPLLAVSTEFASMETTENASTKSGQILGTPAFASPEQLLGAAHCCDQRSDVYSLGATLLFMVTGKIPFDGKELPKRLQQLSEEEHRLLEFETFVPKGLAAICRTATRFEPEQRYQTAVALADDVQRFLANEPITVLRDSLVTCWVRWLRKHPKQSIATITTLILVASFSIVGMLTLAAFNRRLDRANTQLVAAKLELERATAGESMARTEAEANLNAAIAAVESYLVEVTNDQRLNETDFFQLRLALLESAKNFFDTLGQQKPGDTTVELTRANALFRLALIHVNMEQPDDALVHIQKCNEIYAKLSEANPQEPIYRQKKAQGLIAYSSMLASSGDTAQANQLLEQAKRLFEGLVNEVVNNRLYRMGLAEVYGIIGVSAIWQNERERAEEMLGKAISLARILQAEDASNADVRQRLGSDLFNLGLFTNNQALVDEAVVVCDQLVQDFPKNPNYRQGQVLTRNGRMRWLDSQALSKAYQEIIELQSKLVNDFPTIANNRATLAQLHHSYAARLVDTDVAKARRHFEAGLELRKQLVDRSPHNLDFAISLGGSYCAMGTISNIENQKAVALEYFAEAEDVLKPILSQQPGSSSARNFLSQTLSGKAKALGCLGRFDDAMAVWKLLTEDEASEKHAFYQQMVADSLQLADLCESLTGMRQATNPEQHLTLAVHCAEQSLFRLATLEYWTVFDADRELAMSHRFEAAVCAARAIAGQGKETTPLVAMAKPDFSEWAHGWLQDEFRQVASGPDSGHVLGGWLSLPELAVLRDDTALAAMSSREAARWKDFWSQVRQKVAAP